jgi:hypothetical protein
MNSDNQVGIAGIGRLKGNVLADRVDSAGIGRSDGAVTCRSFSSAGIFHAEGPISAKEIQIAGVFRTKAALLAEKFRSNGTIIVENVLRAVDADIRFERGSRVFQLEGERVFIAPLSTGRAEQWVRSLETAFNGALRNVIRIEKITGLEVHVEHAEIGTIEGETVVVGPNCLVSHIVFTRNLKVHESSRVLSQEAKRPAPC